MTRPEIGGRRLLAFGVAALLGLSGCNSSSPSGPLPKASELLPRAVAAMRATTSARFELTGKGKIQGVEVDRADGILTSSGDASGTVQITQSGVLVGLDLVVAGGAIYIKGPTGGFAKLPPDAAGTVFDPSQILNHDRGLAALLQTATNATTVGEESVSGVDTYKVTAELDGHLVANLMPLPSKARVPATLWIGVDSPLLDQVMVTIPGSKTGGQQTQLTLRLFDFGVQANITPPPTS